MNSTLAENYSIYMKKKDDFPSLETASYVEPRDLFYNKPRMKFTPLMEVCGERKVFKTTKPIQVRIFQEEEYFFVENENLSIYAHGQTLQEAVKEFSLHIIYFYNYYKNIDKNKLTENAQILKDLFCNLLIEKSNAD